MANFTNSTPFPSVDEYSVDYDGYDNQEGILVYRHFFERQIIAAMFITVAVLGTLGNSFVIVAVALSKKLRTATNVFVVNLAVGDVLTCMFLPWQAVAILGGGDWPIPGARWVCAGAGFIIVITFGCSVNSLALIAINRWVGITKSWFTTRRMYTARKLGLMVVFSCAVPLCCALTPILTDFGELGYEKLYSTCTWDRSNPYSPYYNMLITAVYYPIQLTVIIVCYSSIFCYVRRTTNKMARADALSVSDKVSGGGANRAMRRQLWKRQLAVTKNLLYIVLAFVICLTPYFTAIIFFADWTYRLTPWAGAVLFGNSCINPMIYATSHPDFKEAFGHMIRCQKIPRGGSSQRSKSKPSSSRSEVNHGYEEERSQRV